MNRENFSLAEYDPTGTVNLRDPAAVESSIGAILDRRYGANYDRSLLHRCVADLVDCYRGCSHDLMQCDTLYHDLRHALETGLTMARLIDGDFEVGGLEGPTLNASQALLGISLALFHDVGLLRREDESIHWGAQLLPVHEERGVKFMGDYFQETSLKKCAEKSELIMPTKLTFSIPDAWLQEDRKIGSMIASADLISQMADRCYLEKCRDFLFAEFGAIGLSGTSGSPYPDAVTLLRKTPGFVNGFAMDRLDREFRGVFRLVEAHFSGSNPYLDAISRHVGYLVGLLGREQLPGLRRRPKPFVGLAEV